MTPRAPERPVNRCGPARRRAASRLAAVALLAAAFWCGNGARAEERSAGDFVQALIDDALRCDASSERAAPDLATRISRYIDIERMARTALGAPFDQLDAGQRERYLRAYGDLVRRVVAKFCTSNGVVLEKLGSRRSGDTEIVAFRLRRANDEHDLYWYVRAEPPYAVVDIATDGVLVTERQRREFAAIIRRHDGDLTALAAAIDGLQP